MRKLIPWLIPVGLLAVVVATIAHAFVMDRRFEKACRAAGGVPVVQFDRVCYAKPTIIDIKGY